MGRCQIRQNEVLIQIYYEWSGRLAPSFDVSHLVVPESARQTDDDDDDGIGIGNADTKNASCPNDEHD